ncbi:MAG: hypothetical protein ACTSRP_17655 [Candidatus Helarchaeota archaeon]
MIDKRKIYLTIIFMVLFGSSVFILPVNALGNTSLTIGNKLVYTLSANRSQDWKINGTWEDVGAPGTIVGWVLLNESRTKLFTGTITVLVLGVRYSVVDLQITYNLRDTTTTISQQINDSTGTLQYYRAPINISEYPNLPPIVTTTTKTMLTYSDSFEIEVDIRTRRVLEMYKYNASELLSLDFYNFVTYDTVYCTYWIFPDSTIGDKYLMSFAGLNHELRGDMQNYLGLGDGGYADSLQYEIERSTWYFAPSNGLGGFQNVWIATYEFVHTPDTSSQIHPYTIDIKSYLNEFIYDADTGILLQYHRVFKIEPYNIIDENQPGNEKNPIYENADMYNLDYKLYLSFGSIINLGLAPIVIIIIIIGVIAAVIVILYLYFKKRR